MHRLETATGVSSSREIVRSRSMSQAGSAKRSAETSRFRSRRVFTIDFRSKSSNGRSSSARSSTLPIFERLLATAVNSRAKSKTRAETAVASHGDVVLNDSATLFGEIVPSVFTSVAPNQYEEKDAFQRLLTVNKNLSIVDRESTWHTNTLVCRGNQAFKIGDTKWAYQACDLGLDRDFEKLLVVLIDGNARHQPGG